MPITLGLFGNFNTSRVKKIMSASNQAEATHMGGWDRFKDYFSGGAKQTRLNNLWTNLQSNSDQATDNPNIKKFITFTKIKDLADNEHHNRFTAKLEKSPTGFTSELNLQIDGENILSTKNVLPLEHNTISNFLEDTGQIKSSANEESITQQQQQHAATKIQAGWRVLRSRINQKQESEFGFKQLDYTSKNANDKDKRFLYSKNLNSFTVPTKSIQNGEEGTFKQVIAKDEHSVLFFRKQPGLSSINKNLQHPWVSHDIEKVLNELQIKTFKVTHQINATQEIAHNAGSHDLYAFIRENFIDVEPLKPLLSDMKKLHSNGYFHLDLKTNNIQVKMANNKPVLSVIDLDSFSSQNKLSKYSGTASFTTGELHLQCFPPIRGVKHTQPPTVKQLQTFDEFGFAVTMLEATGNYNADVSLMDKSGLEITPEIQNFIDTKIKQEYRKQFSALIIRPVEYAPKYLGGDNQIYLADMLE